MRLDDAPESGNVDDNRGSNGTRLAIGGAGGVLLLILGLIFGPDFLNQVQQPQQQPAPDAGRAQGPRSSPDETLAFVKKVLGTTEAVWSDEFRLMGHSYTPPRLELFSEEVQTGCGRAPSAIGPFYCPADRRVYLDPTFFDELEQKLGGSKADFSKAYVIAHEVGHHVQNLLGYSARVDEHRGKRD